MTTKRIKVESEVLRFRNEGQWTKNQDALKQMVVKYGESDSVVKLIRAEIVLETFLANHDPSPDNIRIAQKSLATTKQTLTELTGVECKDSLFSVAEESSLILAKVLYAQGNLTACFDLLDKVDLEKVSSKSVYQMRLLAEAFALRGLCMEHMYGSGTKETETELQAMKHYESSTAFLLNYLCEYDRVFAKPVSQSDGLVSTVLETAIQRAPLLHIKHRELGKGVNFLRSVLTTVNVSQNLKQGLSVKLASILLRGMAKNSYKNLKPDSALQNKHSYFVTDKASFVPTCHDQEAILLLQIAETILNLDPILDMSPEYSTSREQTLKTAENMYNLLAVALVPLVEYSPFCLAIEHSLKYAFDRFHLWYQFALSLCCSGKTNRALKSLIECCSIDAENPGPALIAAKLCYQQNPPLVNMGMHFSQRALDITERCKEYDDDGLHSRAYVCLGIGYSLSAELNFNQQEILDARNKAIQAFTKAHTLDKLDSKALLFLALEHAKNRKILLGFKLTKQCLDLNSENLQALQLLVLLLTSMKQYHEANLTIHAALSLYPDNLVLLAMECKLQLCIDQKEEALQIGNKIIKLFSTQTAYTNCSPEVGYDQTNDCVSVAKQSIGNDLETGSFLANSIAVSRLDKGGASDITMLAEEFKSGGLMAWSSSSDAWVQVAQVYIELDRCDEAEMCVIEAAQPNSLSPTILCMKGKICERRGLIEEAVYLYNQALTVDPNNLTATEQLCGLLCAEKKVSFAKAMLQNAVKIDCTSHTAWQLMADILEVEGEIERSIEYTTLSLNLESTSPMAPFSSINIDF